MFGIGLLELVVIAVLGVLVVGPEKIPDLARQAAALLKSAKHATDSVRDELRENLGPDYADLEITDLHPRSLVRKHFLEAMRDDDGDGVQDEDEPGLDELDELDELDVDDAESTTNELTERHVS